VIAVVLALLAGPAVGQQGTNSRGVDAQVFRPAVDAYGLFSLDGPTTARNYEFGFKFFFDFTKSPLKLEVPSTMGGTDYARRSIIDYQAAFHLQAFMGLFDRFELFLDVPLARQKLGTAFGTKSLGSGTGFYALDPGSNISIPGGAPMDARFGAKGRILTTAPISLAGQFLVTVPFGDQSQFLGEKSVTYQPKVIGSATFGDFTLLLNVGAVLRQEFEKVYDPYAPKDAPLRPLISVGHELTAGVGGSYQITKLIAVGAEVFTGIPLNKVKDGDVTFDRDFYADVVGGFVFTLTPQLTVNLGGGAGVIPDAARRDIFRVFAGIAWSPEGATRVTGDQDGDGIPDDKDACPMEPEDKDGYQDEDGCPDPDNDGDGIVDASDKCPGEAEDRDGFQDEDGCPDPDNDGDGIPDVSDKCPNEPEDVDGYQDEDGCRDDDNDGDGIPDTLDRCPNEPETYNGYEDEDGCPDQLPEEAAPKAGVPMKVGNIEFKPGTAVIEKKSLPLLDRLAADLKKWASLRLRIEAHTNDRGKPDKLLKLSKDRAEAVRQYLIGKGIEPARLIAEGYGSRRPIQSNATAAGRAANERIEFIPVEK